MVGSERFRRLVNSQAGAAANARLSGELAQRFNTLYSGLSQDARDRFDALKKRCESMQDLTDADVGSSDSLDRIADNQLQGVNRLLWVYLKLLHTQASLSHFLEATDEREIVALEQAVTTKLRNLPSDPAAADDSLEVKKRRSLEDTLASAVSRKENIQRARAHLEYVQLELARIGSKVNALAELKITRHDPSLITTEVDDAARSVESTEQAMGELRMFNGLTSDDIQAPEILTKAKPGVRVQQ